VFSCDSETDESSRGTPHLTALLLASRSRGLTDRAATVAECSLEASLVPVLGLAGLAARSVSEEGPNSAPEIDHSGLFEKIGQRFRARSDRVHRVMSTMLVYLLLVDVFSYEFTPIVYERSII
jgi:hypothetical protein